MHLEYILDENNNPVPEYDLTKWARWYSNVENRIVKQDMLPDGVKISTVFLAIDHNFGADNEPILFETIIFGGEHDSSTMRCSTLKQHQEAIELVFS